MTVDVATLGLNVDTSKLKQAERAQDQFGKSAENMERRTKRATDGISRGFSSIGLSAASAAGAITGAIAAMVSVDGIARAAGQYQSMSNALRGMGLDAEEAAGRLDQIAAIATRTRSPLDATVKLYSRISIAAGELGASQDQVAQFTENVGMALGSAGIGANEASGALLQLSQAMSGGTVRAEEFNSILEGAFPLALAAARGIDEAGGSVGRLRQLVIEGKVSSEAFFNAILAQGGQIKQTFEATAITVGQAFTNLGTSLTMAIGQMDAAVGASNALAAAINAVASGSPAFITAMQVLGSTILILAATRIPALIIAISTSIATFTAGATAAGVMTGAVTLLNGAMTLLGGPIGVMAGAAAALGIGLYSLATASREAGEAANIAARAEDELNTALGAVNRTTAFGIAEARTIAQARLEQAKTALMAAKAELALAQTQSSEALDPEASFFYSGNITEANNAAREQEAIINGLIASAEKFGITLENVPAIPPLDPGGKAAETVQEVADSLANVKDAAVGPSASGGGGAAGAMTDAAKAAEQLRQEMDRPLLSAIDGVSNAFGDFVARGFKDFKGFAKSIVNSFKSMLAQMISMAIKNRIMIGLGLGGTVSGVANAATGGAGAIGGIGSIIGGFGTGAGLSGLAGGTGLLGGFGNVVGGFASGGFAGAGSALGTALGGATTGLAGFAGAVGAIAAPLLAVGAIFSFFKKKTTELDSGLNVTVGNLSAAVETFRTIETKRFFGLSKKVSTSSGAASAEVADPIVKSVTEIQQSILTAAEAFGFGADAFAGFSYKFNLSLKGLTQEQALQKVNEELAKMGDAFAGMLPHFSSMNELLQAHAQRIQLEDRLLQLQGKSAELLARQRERELLATHELNRPLLMQIHALEDQAQAAQNAANQMERLMQSNLFESSAERQFAATSFGFTRPMMTQMSEEERALMREIVTAIREGDINQARLTNRLVQMQERQELEPTA